MCFTTIIVIHTTLSVLNVLQKLIFHGRRTCVQPSLLARLAMETSGEPSTWFPLGNSYSNELLRGLDSTEHILGSGRSPSFRTTLLLEKTTALRVTVLVLLFSWRGIS